MQQTSAVQPPAGRAADRADPPRRRAGRTRGGRARVCARSRARREDRPRELLVAFRVGRRGRRRDPRDHRAVRRAGREGQGGQQATTAGNSPQLRSDVDQLQSDVNRLERQVSSAIRARAATSIRSCPSIQDQLKQISDDQQQQAQDIKSVQQDLTELTDRAGPGRAGAGRRGRRRAIAAAAKIVALPGDGIGPEVVGAGLQLLDALAPRFDVGLRDREGRRSAASRSTSTASPLLPEVLERCRASDAVLLGAVGGPKWDSTDPDAPRPEQGLLGLRKGLGLFANLRPVRVVPGARRCQPAARGARARSRRHDRA